MLEMFILLSVVGAFAGLLAGLFGVGAGVLTGYSVFWGLQALMPF